MATEIYSCYSVDPSDTKQSKELSLLHGGVMSTPDYLLTDLLKNVSRSFYLTLRVLPEGLRQPIGLAYLLARAADTIADTQLIPPEKRLELLLAFRAQVNGPIDEAELVRIAANTGSANLPALGTTQHHEMRLLQSLSPALQLLQHMRHEERSHVRRVVTTLTEGMELDLRTFPNETSGKIGALQHVEELDRYTYWVAGCVGDFWTRITVALAPALADWDLEEMCARGVRFGKALQMTNVLRDCAKDLRIGRCYLPLDVLSRHGLRPEDLIHPENSGRARGVLAELLPIATGHYRAACVYALAIPPGAGRLRLACLWPILIGLDTLNELAGNSAWLDPERPSKISRKRIYTIMLFSLVAAGSDTAMNAWLERWIVRIEKRAKACALRI